MTSTGGYFSEVSEPYKLKFGTQGCDKRRIIITSRVYGLNSLGNGHHHASVTEEDNWVWNETRKDWWQPWKPDIDKDYDGYMKYKSLFNGRSEWNSDFIFATDVIKWANGILKEWGVTEENFKVEWDLDADDLMAIHVAEVENKMSEGEIKNG